MFLEAELSPCTTPTLMLLRLTAAHTDARDDTLADISSIYCRSRRQRVSLRRYWLSAVMVNTYLHALGEAARTMPFWIYYRVFADDAGISNVIRFLSNNKRREISRRETAIALLSIITFSILCI